MAREMLSEDGRASLSYERQLVATLYPSVSQTWVRRYLARRQDGRVVLPRIVSDRVETQWPNCNILQHCVDEQPLPKWPGSRASRNKVHLSPKLPHNHGLQKVSLTEAMSHSNGACPVDRTSWDEPGTHQRPIFLGDRSDRSCKAELSCQDQGRFVCKLGRAVYKRGPSGV